MAIFEIRSTITFDSLMKKSKEVVARMVLETLDFCHKKEQTRLKYENALKSAIPIIKAWHGEEAFDIYLLNSPECSLIREALFIRNEYELKRLLDNFPDKCSTYGLCIQSDECDRWDKDHCRDDVEDIRP